MYYGRRSTLKGFSEQKLTLSALRLNRVEKCYILFATCMVYASLGADLWALTNYAAFGDNQSSGDWFHTNTLFIAVAPGIFHCWVEQYTIYFKPRKPKELAKVAVGEVAPLFKYRDKSGGMMTWWYLINFFHARQFVECFLSFKYGFITGAWKDAIMLKSLGSFLQALQQVYILFVSIDQKVSFSWYPTYVSFGVAMLLIMFVPNESPCFEDNRHLMIDADEDHDQGSIELDDIIDRSVSGAAEDDADAQLQRMAADSQMQDEEDEEDDEDDDGLMTLQ